MLKNKHTVLNSSESSLLMCTPHVYICTDETRNKHSVEKLRQATQMWSNSEHLNRSSDCTVSLSDTTDSESDQTITESFICEGQYANIWAIIMADVMTLGGRGNGTTTLWKKIVKEKLSLKKTQLLDMSLGCKKRKVKVSKSIFKLVARAVRRSCGALDVSPLIFRADCSQNVTSDGLRCNCITTCTLGLAFSAFRALLVVSSCDQISQDAR